MLESKYDIGDFVYIITDEEQKRRQITGINFRSTGVVYEVFFGIQRSEHYDFEISDQPDVVLKTNT